MSSKKNNSFENNYFLKYYPNYEGQNPVYKAKAMLNLLKKYRPEGKLLDVGCAFGSFIKSLVLFYTNLLCRKTISLARNTPLLNYNSIVHFYLSIKAYQR